MKQRKHIHEDVVTSLFFIIFAVVYMLQGIGLKTETTIFPNLFAGVILILSIGTLISGIKKTKELNAKVADGENVGIEISWEKLRGPVITTVMALLYIAMMNFIGFFVATTIFIPAFIWMQGYHNKKTIALVTVGTDILVYVCFCKLLLLSLPKGLLI